MKDRPPPIPGWAKAINIQGWFDQREARLLSKLCTGLWCEIGCYKGRSTTVLAASGHDGYAIDTWLGSPKGDPTWRMPKLVFEEFIRRMEPYENVIIVRSPFENSYVVGLVPKELELLHLDADHSYEMTKLAFDLYSPKVVQGGHVCFHDAHGGGWPEVEQFVGELDEEVWRHVESAGMLAAYQRIG